MQLRLSFSRKEINTVLASALVFIFCVEIPYITQIFPTFTRIQGYVRIVVLAFIIVGVLYRKAIHLFRVVYLLIFLSLVILFSTLINGGQFSTAFNALTPMLIICLFLEFYKDKETQLSTVMDVWKWLCFIYVIIDLISILLIPSGLYETSNGGAWILGYKTNRLVIILPMLVLFGYQNLRKRGRLGVSFAVVYIIGLMSCLLINATGCWVSLILFLLLYFLMRMFRGRKVERGNRFLSVLLDYKFFFIVYAVILILFFFAEQFSIIDQITTFFDKSATLSGRSYIWEAVINIIISKPIFGHGYLFIADYESIFNLRFGFVNPHNAILTVLLYSGIIGLIIFATIIAKVMRNKKQQFSLERIFLITAMYGLFIVGITSATMVFSEFGFLIMWMLEHEQDKQLMAENIEISNKGEEYNEPDSQDVYLDSKE